MKNNIITFLFLFCFFAVSGQLKYYAQPLKIPASVSGNFGELRPNHFHTGIDFRTQHKTGLPVYSSSEGYVSRIVVSPTGYGKALYIEHSNNTTTLYGHLDKFRDDIEAYVKEEQYRRQSYAVDLGIPSGKFKTGRQEQIALSGNSGSSAGPHLHFEIRDTESQDALNPLLMDDFNIKDKTPPRIQAIQIYPLSEQSHVELTAKKKSFPVKLTGNVYQLTNVKSVRAYGNIGIAVKASDYFDEDMSPCGIYGAQLFVNGEKVFAYNFSRIPFDQNRYLNSHIDYEDYILRNIRYQKLWRDTGNGLFIYESGKSRGILQIDSGKVYNCEIVLSDAMGNKARLAFTITGQYAGIPVLERKPENIFSYDSRNRMTTDDFEIYAPVGAFYEDFPFTYSFVKGLPGYYSAIHRVHVNTTPIHKPVKIRIKTQGLPSSLCGKAFIANISEIGAKSYTGGKLSGDWIETDITEFGSYAVICDTVPPRIVPLGIKNNALTESNRIRFKITDNLSGIKSYRGMIDDHWALFEYDPKYNLLVYHIDPERLTLGKRHSLELTVSDQVNNTAIYKATFWK